MIIEFIYEILRERVVQIIPNKEVKYLIPCNELKKTPTPLYDLIFVFERYLKSKIIPCGYKILYSSSFDKSDLSDKVSKNLCVLEKILGNGDGNVNSDLFGFLPKSSKRYLDSGINGKRYRSDFINQFFGVRHFHLDSHDTTEDKLLYYVVYEKEIYFLKIGKHEDLYSQEIVEIIVSEFPSLLNHLGIHPMPDMPVVENFKYGENDVKEIWINGGNVSFVIQGQYYVSTNNQTFSRLTVSVINIVENIFYQIQTQLDKFQLKLKEDYPEVGNFDFEIVDYDESEILIGEKNTMEAVWFRISYLQNIKVIDTLLSV